ncbi:hypothetical protein N2152v2_005052 [Parachlorella kessleri]
MRRFQLAAAAAASLQGGANIASATRGGLAASSYSQPPTKRYAVIGGGFAGVAVAFHLLSHANPTNPISLDLYEAFGLGAGGSGAAAGLLHPYTTRGKVLWRGLEAFEAALELVQAAEGALPRSKGSLLQITWTNGILRPARSQKQAQELAKFVPQDPATAEATGAQLLDSSIFEHLVPGLPAGSLIAEEEAQEAQGERAPAVSLSPQQLRQQERVKKQQLRQQHRQSASAADQAAAASAAGLLMRNAVVLHPLRYLEALWAACCQQAKHAGQGSEARLIPRAVASLGELEKEWGPYDAVVVAAGAAVGRIAELEGMLPVQLCQGYTLAMQPPATSHAEPGRRQQQRGQEQGEGVGHVSAAHAQSPQHAEQAPQQPQHRHQAPQQPSSGLGPPPPLRPSSYPVSAPSLLGPTYISAHGPNSLVVGATKRYGLSAEDAFAECARGGVVESQEGRQEAMEALLPVAGELWPPILGWEVAQVKSGVRALPARGREGSIPFAGRVPIPAFDSGKPSDTSTTTSTLGHTLTAQPHSEHQEEEGQVGQQQQQQPEGGGTKAPGAAQKLERGGNWWFVGGLGARGLVYHAWLGRLLADAVSRDDEGVLPPELLRWKAAD